MKNQLIKAIIFFCVVTFLLQFYENSRLEGFANKDSYSYLEAAKFLHKQNFKIHPYRPPVYPLILGLPYLFNIEPKVSDFYPIFVNICLWLLTVLLIYKTVIRMSNYKLASWASSIFILNFGNVTSVYQPCTETMFTFFMCLLSYFLCKFFLEKKDSFFYFFILIFCLSILVRPTCYVLVFILPLFLLLLFKDGWLNLKNIFVSLAIAFLIITPQVVLMKKYYKTATVSTIGVMAYYAYLSAYSNVILKYTIFRETSDSCGKLTDKRRIEIYQTTINGEIDWAKVNEKARQDFKFQLKNNATNLFFAFGKNVFSNSKGYSIEVNRCKNIKNFYAFNVYQKALSIISQLQNIIHSLNILIFSPFFFWRYRKILSNEPLFHFCSTINFIGATIIILSGISFGQGDRFNIVTVPISIILGGFCYCIYMKRVTMTHFK